MGRNSAFANSDVVFQVVTEAGLTIKLICFSLFQQAVNQEEANSEAVPSPKREHKYSAEETAEWKKRKVYFQKMKMVR